MKKWFVTLCMLLWIIALGVPVYAAGTARMNISSVTLVEGETYQLKALVNDKVKKASSWSSERPAVASVSSAGKVMAKKRGSSFIRAKVSGKTVECLVSVVKKTDTESVRYSVLIMDTSKSMKGSALTYAKSAAKAFAKTVLGTDGRNYVALETLGSSSKVVCEFTGKLATVNKKIGKLKASGNTNMEAALAKAGDLLKQVPGGKHVTKNIVLLSDGLPNKGKKRTSGHYSKSLHKDYKYANAAYATDTKLKKKYFVYALGFFHKVSKKDLKFGKRLMKDLASTDKYYIITDKSKISDAMEDIADIITTVTISQTKLTLYVGETAQLQLLANNQPKSGSWKAGNTTIATISDKGVVTGKQAGVTKITGTYKGEKSVCTVTVKNPKMTVTFDGCGGKATEPSKTVTYTKTYGTLPTAARKGYTFAGWYIAKSGGKAVTEDTIVTKLTDHTLYAHWKAKPHRYKVYDIGGLTREEAKTKCEELGGYLASINSEEEQKLIEELLDDAQMHSYWLGGFKKDGTWYWEDGSRLIYDNWDTSAEEGSGSEPCMAIVGIPRSGTGKSFGEWLDTYNEGYGNEYGAYYSIEHFGYICEWEE